MKPKTFSEELHETIQNYARVLQKLHAITDDEQSVIIAAATLRVLLKQPVIIWVGQVMYKVDDKDKLTIKDERLT